jgi:hypothetical protein
MIAAVVASLVLQGAGAAQAQAPCVPLPGGLDDVAEVIRSSDGPAVVDSDGDGEPDATDVFPYDYYEQRDSDADGVGDRADAFPMDPREWADSDCDGVGDNADDEFDGPVTVEVEAPWTDGVYSWTAAFTLTSTGEGAHTASLSIHLDGPRDAEREQAWEAAIEDMWSRGELLLDVTFVDSAAAAHSTVEVRPGEGWSNAGTWFAEDGGLVVAHEVGHQLGLFDEYPDPAVPHRYVGSEDSIMRTPSERASPRTHPWHQALVQAFFDCL